MSATADCRSVPKPSPSCPSILDVADSGVHRASHGAGGGDLGPHATLYFRGDLWQTQHLLHLSVCSLFTELWEPE